MFDLSAFEPFAVELFCFQLLCFDFELSVSERSACGLVAYRSRTFLLLLYFLLLNLLKLF